MQSLDCISNNLCLIIYAPFRYAQEILLNLIALDILFYYHRSAFWGRSQNATAESSVNVAVLFHVHFYRSQTFIKIVRTKVY